MTDNSSISLSLTDVWRAWAAFRRGKKSSREILAFEAELELNLLRLCVDLNTGRYAHGPYSRRIVNEKKRRDIAVASVRDRIVHRILYDYLVPIVDPRLDYDVWSCRPGKGLHRALLRTETLVNKYSHVWFWRADIAKFFDSVNHEVLRDCLKRIVVDPVVLALLDEIIYSYSTTDPVTGIPIGNLTSQIFANIYFHEFDRFARHQVQPYAYLRYGDDFALFMEADDIYNAQTVCTEWILSNLRLRVNVRNTIAAKAGRGLLFLGHQIYPGSPLSVDKRMLSKIMTQLNLHNAGSYYSMHVPASKKKLLPWLL